MPQEKPLVLTEESDALQLYPRPPILTSLDVGWCGVCFAYMCQPAYEVPEVSTPRWHSIAIFTHGNRIIHADRKLDGRFHRDAVVGGDIVITPVNIGQGAAWEDEGDFIILGIEADVFARTIDEAADAKDLELLPHFATPDPLIYQIGLALKSVLENNPTNSRLYAETMINALSVHLMQHYSTRKPILQQYKDGLPKYKFKKVIDYINAHLEQDLSLTELAALVQMSPHYFSHLFKQSVGISAHQYVIRCRVERAKNYLLQGDLSIAEVAYKVGFANQSHLNRHFKRLLGITPKQI
ncbi:AraC family transcriptional regulator [Plectonema radiosum NIES-515]|uniref:AraC family transcriptional regulator n=1 Tax=Plectonema radiosum NIES-515 TaxID=2986073 RepID=A0ABT3B1S0_9CYAN|nr:AraC family transcriptional regulator [Plectonema radiosum]MCV3215326.1 AraC family transcriptional regulator [Plectonema radiosum NIES-515]